MPETAAELEECMSDFDAAGFTGAVGSTDATAVVLERLSYAFRMNHKGFKSSNPTRAFQITVNHRRKILATTIGLPGRWNDKTVIRFDNFITGLRKGTLGDVVYRIAGEAIRGAWVLVDNGYLPWSVTIPPFKRTTSRMQARWSEWLESMRKDVECTFGILKGRWRILKTGIRVHSLEQVDDIWFTCCALHNMLLHVDGLDKGWTHGMTCSDYERHLGLHELGDVEEHVPEIFRRLKTMGLNRSHDDSHDVDNAMFSADDEDQENDVVEEEEKEEEEEEEAARGSGEHVVRRSDLSMDAFRGKLVRHFHERWQQDRVSWPSRQNKMKK
jgi:hypothetical protein